MSRRQVSCSKCRTWFPGRRSCICVSVSHQMTWTVSNVNSFPVMGTVFSPIGRYVAEQTIGVLIKIIMAELINSDRCSSTLIFLPPFIQLLAHLSHRQGSMCVDANAWQPLQSPDEKCLIRAPLLFTWWETRRHERRSPSEQIQSKLSVRVTRSFVIPRIMKANYACWISNREAIYQSRV